MSDLGLSDAVWLRFMREFGYFLRRARPYLELKRRHSRERAQVINWNDFNSNFIADTANSFSGVHLGTNTNERGEVYVRITGGPTYTVSLYTTLGAAGLVAQGTGAVSAQVTLAEQNSSGLSGSIKLNSSVTVETDDVHLLVLMIDDKLEHLKIWPSDGTTEDDAPSRAAAQRLSSALEDLADSALARIVAAIEEWALSAVDNDVARGNAFTKSAESTLIREAFVQDSSGTVTRTRSGFLEVLSKAMEDNTTGATQDILRRSVARSSVTFDGNNDGQGQGSSVTSPDDHCPLGTWRFDCTKGVGTNDGGREEFSGNFASSIDDTNFTFRGLRIKQDWQGPNGFGKINIARTFTKTGDGSNVNLGAVGTFTTTGETENNTDGGVLYWRVTAVDTNTISWYKGSNRVDGDLVCESSGDADAASTVQATARNGSGLSLTYDVGSNPVLSTDGTLDLNFFHTSNSSNVPDKMEATTTLNDEGKTSRILALVLGYKLNSIASSEQLNDDALAQANTGMLYLDEDV